jgi:flagellar M-ring protein FliF
MGALFTKVKGFWGGLTTPSKRLIVAAGVIFLVGVFVLMRFTGQVEYATLASGVAERDAAAITSELDSLGVTYRLADGGTTIEVPSGSLDQARLDLASSNVLSGSNVGFEIFDKSNLGATDFTNRVNLVRATEGELSRTIGSLEQVQSATVKIAMPEEELFSSEQDPTTAGVVLALVPGAALEPGQVKGITRLVSNAVPGLEAGNVTVTDSQGNILDAAEEELSGATAAAKRLALEQQYEQSVQARLDSMIAAVLGPGKAVVQVDAALDLDKVTTDEETFDPESSTPLEAETSNESLDSEGGAAGTPAGTAVNTPGGATYPAGGAAGAGETAYRKRTRRETNGVDRTRSQIERAEGAVTRQSVAVQVSDEVPAATVASLEESVAAAVGIQEGRDQLSVVTIPFAEDGTAKLAASGANAAPAVAAASGGMSQADMIKTGAAALGVLILLLLSWRSLRRRQKGLEKALPELLKGGPVPVAELAAPVAVAVAEPTQPMHRLEGQSKTAIEAQMEDLALRRPEDVAQLIRGWLVEKR